MCEIWCGNGCEKRREKCVNTGLKSGVKDVVSLGVVLERRRIVVKSKQHVFFLKQQSRFQATTLRHTAPFSQSRSRL